MVIGVAHSPALVALLLAVTAPSVVTAEPRRLADAEMDRVTAAGVAVEVDAYAHALGSIALARTDTRALTSIVKDRIQVGAGFAEGQAYACCGPGASVAVGSSAAGGGDMVYSGTVSHVFHGASLAADGVAERFTFGYSAALLLTASSDVLLGSRDVERALGGLGRELIGGGQAPSEDGLVIGFAFVPVYAAGLRWRATRHLTGQAHDLGHVATASQAASRRLTRARQAVSWK